MKSTGAAIGGEAKVGFSAAAALRRFWPIAILAAGIALAFAFDLHHRLSLAHLVDKRAELQAFVDRNALAAAASFVALYVVVVTLSLPVASALTIVSGFLFGWLLGSALVAFAATLGATLLFLAARHACGDLLHKRLGGYADRLARGFEQNAFTFLLALRLAPFIPFFVVNIAPAFFDVKAKTYVAATLIGILPGVLAFSWLGVGLDSALAASQQAGRDFSPRDLLTPEIGIAFAALGVVAIVAAVLKSRYRAAA